MPSQMHFSTSSHGNVRNLQEFSNAQQAVQRIKEIYDQSTSDIIEVFQNLQKGDSKSTLINQRFLQNACYPYVGFNITAQGLCPDPTYSYGVALEPGFYGSTVTRPDIFGSYYEEQIQLLMDHHNVPIVVGVSDWPIPLPFVIDHVSGPADADFMWHMQNTFTMPNLTRIDDTIANCTYQAKAGTPNPLALFSAERVDFSLNRLHHYTGTNPTHFQGFILLTNYQRYIEEFIQFSMDEIQNGLTYTHFVMPGDVVHTNKNMGPVELHGSGTAPKHLPQMPAYHLKMANGQGITFINIGVSPANTKNITDHLAVLRPHCWIMLGHCAGLRSSQLLGDYVLAHAYLRKDNVLDQDLPNWVPLPPIAEVQQALQQAVENIFQEQGHDLKKRMRTGTVVTTDNRNWELQSTAMYEMFRQSRAIALDMESATVAGNGFRFRVPYGTLLCVSDKPIHGEIKLRGMANKFYQESVSQHLKVGLEAIRILRENGVDQLHSRKLRGFDEPPFR